MIFYLFQTNQKNVFLKVFHLYGSGKPFSISICKRALKGLKKVKGWSSPDIKTISNYARKIDLELTGKYTIRLGPDIPGKEEIK